MSARSGRPRATGRSSATTCSSIARLDDETVYGLKPMNCPGHMLLFGTRCTATASCRFAMPRPGPSIATSSRAPSTGCSASGTSSRTTRTFSAREEQVPAELDGCIAFAVSLRLVRPRAARRAVDAAGATSWARTRSGIRPRAHPGGARAARARVRDRRGRGNVLRTEDRPPHDRLAGPLAGRSGRSSSTGRCRSVLGSPTWARTTTSTRRSSSTAPCSARSSASSASSSSTTRCVPVLARAGTGANHPCRRGAP